MRLLSKVKTAYHILNLLGMMGWAFVYFRWQLRGATKTFERQLRAEGLPGSLVSELTHTYASQFKRLPGNIFMGSRIWRKHK